MASDNFEISDLTPVLQKAIDQFFGARPQLNIERKKELASDPVFLSDLEGARKNEHIPRTLRPEEDIQISRYEYDEHATLEQASYYLDHLGKSKRASFRRATKRFLHKYKLPINFTEWIQYALLFRHFPSNVPRYNWGLIEQILTDPGEAERIGLNAAEKKFWLRAYRAFHGFGSGRVPKAYESEYRKLVGAFKKSKNRLRRSRIAGNVLEMWGLKDEELECFSANDVIRKKKSYRDLAAELTDVDSEEQTNKIAEKFRKRTQRYKKRLKSFRS